MNSHRTTDQTTVFGIVGGPESLAGMDMATKLSKSASARTDGEHIHVILEQIPREQGKPCSRNDHPSAFKLNVYDTIQRLVEQKADYIILPCFTSHTFLDELAQEVCIPILNMMQGLHRHVETQDPRCRRIGIMTSDYVREKNLFERYFPAPDYELIYPDPDVQSHLLMEAIDSPEGIKAGHTGGETTGKLKRTCSHLVGKGAEWIIPGFAEIPVVFDILQIKQAFPLVDSNQVYADWAIESFRSATRPKTFKIGIIGGVGPSATVDFMDKIIRKTPAAKDQEHVKMIIEHNPQIPDRTAHLVGDGEDPTLALYSCAKQLERNNADLIAIPCNTAHAFVDLLQKRLAIPIVNMIDEVVAFASKHFPGERGVGLLATTGTVQSRIYHRAFASTGMQLVAPDEATQALVMEAIYGKEGIKAGFIVGKPRELLLKAGKYLTEQGAGILILGCTEIPLVFQGLERVTLRGKEIALLDPTSILAEKCLEMIGRGRS